MLSSFLSSSAKKTCPTPLRVFSKRVLSTSKHPFLARLGLKEHNEGCFDGKRWRGSGPLHSAVNPSTGETIATVQFGAEEDYEACLTNMESVRKQWASTPAPVRGDIVRKLGLKLREYQEDLGALISLEMGKIKTEGIGEVQEYIDMCDLAAGMSRQIPGQVLPSERQDHTMLEVWNPLGQIGIISAFNFPCAVAGWNTSVSLVCGNTQIWKGASSSSLVTIAQTKILNEVLEEAGFPGSIATMCQGSGRVVGERLIHDKRLNLISFTGSTNVGRGVSSAVASRFGSSILELGGNNAVIVMDDADLDVAIPSVLFAAAGTAGQRCTTLRRLVLHEKIYDEFVAKLKAGYSKLKPGNPLEPGTLLGPLHNKAGVKEYLDGIEEIKKQGGKILYGGSEIDKEVLEPLGLAGGNYVWPTLVESRQDMPIVKEELFVPITHILKVSSFEEAVEVNNSTPFGLSSALFTNSMRHTFNWVGPNGSECGIINVNTSCSGAEIGGAFGGEKDTGIGRESGSDAWKQYMRRGTCAINFGTSVPLSQGVDFSVS